MRSLRRGFVVSLVAGATAVGALALAAAPAAQADGVTRLHVRYDANGSSTVKSTGSVVTLGPTRLAVYVSPDGSFTGRLPLPAQKTTFNVLGFVPVSATVNFVPVGGANQVKGLLKPGSVTSTAKYFIRLTDVSLAGIPAFVGDACQTVDPVVIPANTPAGGTFNITTGGTLTGSYTIGSFANCGLTTGLVNILVPGSGNTETITLSNGKLLPS